ncbi:MAG: hypothetical protein H6574_11365 [Lewinellaceae bacterium]|nr:hypothetical protein [Lewinellaceae bacterium]MCB9331673.1 hypothetical protein [Lewinellaceae bacterium]
MKRLLFILGIILLGSALRAQPDTRDDRLKTYRIAIFTEVLALTPEEAEGFWPVYNDYLDKRDQMQEDLKPKKRLDLMSDSEVEDQVKRHFEMRQRDVDLEKELYQKLRSVIALRKIVKIPEAEREFREQLLIKLREARAKRQAQQRRPGRN